MDRNLVYIGSIPQDVDILNVNKNTMLALGSLIQAAFGTSTTVDGLSCTPTTPASMGVTVGPGSVYALQNVDGTAYGSLPADTTGHVMKQGLAPAAQIFPLAAPTGTGQSVVYLVQAAYQDADAGAAVLPYYNASNPAASWSGPNNTGVSQNTVRRGVCLLGVKTGVAAPTGTQSVPAPDAGYVGLWAVTVANGATTVTSGNIATAPNAPFLATKLPALGSMATQAASAVAVTGGTVNGTSVGGTTPAPGSFTTLTSTGNVTLAGGGSTVQVAPSSGDGSFTVWGNNNSGSWGECVLYSASGSGYTGTLNAQPFGIRTNNAQAAQFDAAGNFYVGGTTRFAGALVSVNGNLTVGGLGSTAAIFPSSGDGSFYVWGNNQSSSWGKAGLYSASGYAWAGTTNNQPFQLWANGSAGITISTAQVASLANQPAANDSSSNIASTGFCNPANSQGANGYVKLPSGVIIQWGTVSNGSSHAANTIQPTAFSFPVTFPNTCWSVSAIMRSGFGTNVFTSLDVESVSASGATYNYLSGSTGSSQSMSYIAIGN